MDRLKKAQKALIFFSNEGKKERERWVLDKWLEIKFHDAPLPKITCPPKRPDFILDEGLAGERFVEIVEILHEGRKRYAEFQRDLRDAEAGKPFDPIPLGLEDIDEKGIQWITETVGRKIQKYSGKHDISNWILVIYANIWMFNTFDWDTLLVQIAGLSSGFRSIDIVYAQEGSPLQVRTIWQS